MNVQMHKYMNSYVRGYMCTWKCPRMYTWVRILL